MRSPSSAEGRCIVVAHRLPLCVVPNTDAPYGFDFSADSDDVVFKHSRGLPGRVVFVGTLPAAAALVPASEELATHLLERFSCCPVFLGTELHKDFYGAYVTANTRFAKRVLELLITPDADHVYIHDYHLLMLPSILRKQSPGTRTYFTLHSPFPSSAIISSSHMGKELLCNLLSSDSVSFLCFDDARHFLFSCTRLLNISYVSTRGYITIHYLKRAVLVRIIGTSSGRVIHQMPSQLVETGAKARDITTKYVVSKMYPDNWIQSSENDEMVSPTQQERHNATLKEMIRTVQAGEGLFSKVTIEKPILSMNRNTECNRAKYRSILQDHVDMVSSLGQGLNKATSREVFPMATNKMSTYGGFFSARTLGKYMSTLENYDYKVTSQGLNKSSTLEVFQLPRKKMLTSETLFTRLILENLDGKHRSSAQDYYGDTVSPQGLTTQEKIRLLIVLCLDPNNITSFVSGCNSPALHKLMSADLSSQRKNSTFSERIPSYLGQLVAASNSSSSAGHRPPLIRFLLDSGASMHVVGDAQLLHHLRHFSRAGTCFATLPDGSRLPIIGVGTIQMDGFIIPNVYLVEGLTVNLVSVSRLATEHGICCCFLGNRCQLMLLADGRTRVIGEAVLENDGVYGLRFLRVPEATS